MDTGSHLLFGVTLAGLAMLDPVVAAHPPLFYAVMAGTVIGSNAPDFDTVMRLKGNAAYIRHHRGVTHSLSALVLWPILLSLLLAALFHVWAFSLHLLLWVAIAVVFHVFVDLLNAYGVQCLRPFSHKWFHLDILCLYEPLIFTIHLAGLIVWWLGPLSPGFIFSTVYVITLVYIMLRALRHHQLVAAVRSKLGAGIIHVIPSLNPFMWQYVWEANDEFRIGEIRSGRIQPLVMYAKEREDPIIAAAKGTDGVRIFLSFAQRIHVSWKTAQDGYEVCWSDLRFWHDFAMPFGVKVRLDRDLNVIGDQIGWNKKAWKPPYV